MKTSGILQKESVIMKKLKLLILVVLLGCILGTASAVADFTIPKIQNPDGYNEIFRSIVISDAVYLLSTKKDLYSLDTKT